MNKDAFINVCNTFKNDIDDMYMFSCLQLSGFTDSEAYDLKGLLKNLWLKDNNDTSISTLSDMLFENYDKIDTKNMNLWDILEIMYESIL